MRKFISKNTVAIRHSIVKRIAPSMYRQYQQYLSTLPCVVPRPAILFVKAINGNQPLVGAEIGVASGVNAESILNVLQIDKLYLIDPYEPYMENNQQVNIYVKDKEATVRRLWHFRDRIEFVYKSSADALDSIPDDLDFVYIDGSHSYDQVKKDIEGYYPKIKENGVCGGHDFDSDHLEVIRAVIEFANVRKLELHAERSDWWIHTSVGEDLPLD